MLLQAILDVLTLNEAYELAKQLCEIVDIIEIGTPMIVRDGMASVRTIQAGCCGG